jgi:hypothetical protein
VRFLLDEEIILGFRPWTFGAANADVVLPALSALSGISTGHLLGDGIPVGNEALANKLGQASIFIRRELLSRARGWISENRSRTGGIHHRLQMKDFRSKTMHFSGAINFESVSSDLSNRLSKIFRAEVRSWFSVGNFSEASYSVLINSI